MAGQEPGAAAPQGRGFRIYARQAGEGLRARPRLRAVTLGPVALVVLLLLAWSSANEGGAVQRREARGVTVEDSRVQNAKPVKTTPAQVVKAVVQPDDGGFVPFARRKRPGARVKSKSNNEAANEATEQTGPVTGVEGEDEEGVRRSSRDEPIVVNAEDVERARAESEARERAIAEASERRKERGEKSPAKLSEEKTATAYSNPNVVIDSKHDHLFEDDDDQTGSGSGEPKTTQPKKKTDEPKKEMDQPKNGGRVGFYLQMANEPKATLELIRSVRVHFPDAPLSVTSDAGSYDCSAACETYGCVFTREDTTAGMHGGGGVMEYVRRLKRAAESAETEWIVLLEDDVRVERGVTRWPKEGIDGGGVQDWRWTAPLSKELLAEIARRNGGRAPSMGDYGCAGAIVRASALASLPDDPPEEEMRSLQKMDDRFGMGPTFPAIAHAGTRA